MTNADLSAFVAHQRQLLVYHGWSDQASTAANSVNYYDSVLRRPRNARDGVRLFMVPAWRTAAAATARVFDMIAAVDTWVETKAAPATIPASRVVDGQAVRTRPLCAYPAVATYKGSGSTDDAANFICR
jgi:feruloyl esterase